MCTTQHTDYALRVRPVRRRGAAYGKEDGASCAVRLRSSPREPALRKARICYDHLAGALGTALLARIIESGWATRMKDSCVIEFSSAGEHVFGWFFGQCPPAGSPRLCV